MELSISELGDVAAFFARRMTVDLAPCLAGTGDLEERRKQWLHHLVDAQDGGCLREVALDVAAQYPGDVSLQEACLLLAGGQEEGAVAADVSAFTIVAAVAAMLLLTTVSFTTAGGLALWESSQSFEGPSQASVSPLGQESAVLAPTVEAAPVVVQGPTMPEADEDLAFALPDDLPTRCTVSGGGLVGYWYAGKQAPGAYGELLTIKHAVNVRRDYPSKSNRWNAREPISCVLSKDDVVFLSKEPVLVDGGRYWVPLYSGDLRVDGRKEFASR